MRYGLSVDTVTYRCGHKLQDVRLLNDYDLICPVGGPVGFVNLGIAMQMEGMTCPYCRKPIGSRVSGEVGKPVSVEVPEESDVKTCAARFHEEDKLIPFGGKPSETP